MIWNLVTKTYRKFVAFRSFQISPKEYQPWCTVVLVLNRYGAQLCSCSIDTVRSCTRAQSTRCPVSLVCNWIVLSRWCTVNFVLNSLVPTCSKNGVCNRSGAHLYLCMTESCLIARAQSIRCTNDRCSIFPTDTVLSEYGAQLYLCAIEPCPIGRAQSTRCTVVGAQLYLRVACSVDMVHSYSRAQSVRAQLVVLNRYRAQSYGAQSVPSQICPLKNYFPQWMEWWPIFIERE